MKLRYLIAAIILVMGLLFGYAFGFVTGVTEPPREVENKPTLCKVETTGVGAENRIFARTADGEVYSWYQDEGEPASAFYIIALDGERVVNALPLK